MTAVFQKQLARSKGRFRDGARMWAWFVGLGISLLCLGLAPVPSHAWTLSQVQQQLASRPVVRAQFEQSRWIGTMPKPLKSSGRLIMARDRGLWWQQEQPFGLTLVLTDTRMMQQVAGQAPEVMTADSSPQMFDVVRLLRAVLQADQAALQQNFRMDFKTVDSGWHLHLQPRTSPLDRLFDAIDLGGTAHLRTVVLKDHQGDRTEIHFSDPLPGADVLSNAETQHFQF